MNSDFYLFQPFPNLDLIDPVAFQEYWEEQEEIALWLKNAKEEKRNRSIDRSQELSARKKMNEKLKRLKKEKFPTQYQKGLILLFSACLNQDPSYDDTDQQTEDIKKAGQMINESKGIKGMSSSYIWDCMPKRMSGSVACFWHGIGEWKD